MHLLLVRHGETDWNRKGILQGQADVPLSEAGESQAARLRPFFQRWRPDLLWVSPLMRAEQTAAILTEGLALPTVRQPRLMERGWGILEGLTRQAQEADHPEVLRTLRRDPLDARAPGGESYRAFWSRVAECLDDLDDGPARLAVVAHGGSLKVLLGAFLGQRPGQAPAVNLKNAHVSLVERKEGTFTLHAVNIWPGDA